MTSCSNSETIRRCRPLLGTFVEVTVSGLQEAKLVGAVDAAFSAIATVQRLMSFHDPASEISELNRLAARRAVPVNPWTYEVLRAARTLAIESAGAFDITLAPLLQQWGYLPPAGRSVLSPTDGGGPLDIELRPGERVQFRRPVRIDLGGIAKGFAVDQAVAVLQARGAASGCVNAGGDLRAFGPAPTAVHVRHPAAPGHFLPLTAITNAALATSACYFTRKRWQGGWVSPLVDPRRRHPCAELTSISVRAPTCLLADALTKVAIADRRAALELLAEYRAEALLVTDRGEIRSLRDER